MCTEEGTEEGMMLALVLFDARFSLLLLQYHVILKYPVKP